MSATSIALAHPSLLGYQIGEDYWIFAASDFQMSTFLLFKRQGFAGDPAIFSFSTELDGLLEELDDGQILDLYRLSGRKEESHWIFGSTKNDLRDLIMSGGLRAFRLDEKDARRMANINDTIYSVATGYEINEYSPINALRLKLAVSFAKDLEDFWIGKDKADRLHWDRNAIHRELVEAVDTGAEVVDYAYDTIVGFLELLVFVVEVTGEVMIARAEIKRLAQRAFANYISGNKEAAQKDLEAIGIKVGGWLQSVEALTAKIQQGLDLFNLVTNDPLTRQLLIDYFDARYESLPFRDSRTVPTRFALEVGVEVLLAFASGGGSALAKISAKAGRAFSAGAAKAAKLSRIGPFTLEMIDLMCDMARLMRKAEMKEVEAPEVVRVYPETKKVKQEIEEPRSLLSKPRNLNNAAVRQALLAKYGVVVGRYKDLQKISKPGFQREHFLPHSNFMERSLDTKSGERRSQVPIRSEFGEYTEGDAYTYFVYDDQSKGTEHRYITDIEKQYAQSLSDNREYATVTQWLDHMESGTAQMFSDMNVEIAEGVTGARIPVDDAADVAKAIRIEYENQLDVLGVDKNAQMSNLVGGGDVPSARSRDSVEF
ncbi:hypothetical protein [Oceanobacter mangrovi]|uniref:hypothetical protein n=1 Tax=Oceanobacter mangrovi TaxID=2862510 RepID=UPI001C8E77E3|nr:hypothetical protein [Oceanobacter mangrovi]